MAGTALCEPPCADFVAGAALCEAPCADFVAGAALCEPPCADFVAGAALCAHEQHCVNRHAPLEALAVALKAVVGGCRHTTCFRLRDEKELGYRVLRRLRDGWGFTSASCGCTHMYAQYLVHPPCTLLSHTSLPPLCCVILI